MTQRFQVVVRLTPAEMQRSRIKHEQREYAFSVSAVSAQAAMEKARELGYQGTILSIKEVKNGSTSEV